MSEAASAPNLADRDTAIDMAVYTGNWLYTQRDDRHFWAMTLIISNLFELVGEGSEHLNALIMAFRNLSPETGPVSCVWLGYRVHRPGRKKHHRSRHVTR